MTTKAKCLALAEQHDIKIEVSKNYYYEYSLSVPKGYQLEDFDGARSGLSMCDIPSAKELWKDIYSDLSTMINYKPWSKVSQGWE
jgi:hypothetical protein